jgi:hypothetical protein
MISLALHSYLHICGKNSLITAEMKAVKASAVLKSATLISRSRHISITDPRHLQLVIERLLAGEAGEAGGVEVAAALHHLLGREHEAVAPGQRIWAGFRRSGPGGISPI